MNVIRPRFPRGGTGRTVLVTGGAGFIGSHVCHALLARGDRVRVIDDLSTGHVANLPEAVEMLRGDAANVFLTRDAMAGVDAVVHLAAVASVEKGARDWLGTHRANLSATVTVFETARRASPQGGPVPVVYASSAAVYGDASSLPIHEGTPTRPLSAYGADKLGCELHARVAGLVHGVPTAGLRFFNVFGPRQDPASPYSGVISIFCDRIRRSQPIRIFGDGEQTRDFIYVDDVVRALLAGLDSASLDAPVFNVCSGLACSVRQLADEVARLCGTPLKVIPEPGRQGEIRHSLGCPQRARALLALGPPTPLHEGLRRVLAWLDEPDRAPIPVGMASEQTQT